MRNILDLLKQLDQLTETLSRALREQGLDDMGLRAIVDKKISALIASLLRKKAISATDIMS